MESTAAKALPDPLLFSGSPVLCHEGGDAMGDALLRRKRVVVHPVYGVEGGDHIHAQWIDGPLNQQLADGLAGLLQRGHAAVAQSLTQQTGVHTEFPPTQLQHGNLPVNITDAQKGRGRLGDHRGGGGADDAKTQPADENQVQHRV